MMKLTKFQVTDFKSVEDSGWIDCDDITTLIGTNEAGKSNVLVALWKLNPAMDGKIHPLSDFPRKSYNKFRGLPEDEKPIFIRTYFELPERLIRELVEITKAPEEDLQVATIDRSFNGEYYINFPNASSKRELSRDELDSTLESTLSDINSLSEAGKGEEGIKTTATAALNEALKIVQGYPSICSSYIGEVKNVLSGVNTKSPLKTSQIAPRFEALLEQLDAFEAILSRPSPSSIQEARTKVLSHLPKFVYYSQYGNLDSEIYLPQVIENLKRTNLTGSTAAKVRTLRVLFDFVQLDPQEIYELGEDFQVVLPDGTRREPTEEEIELASEKKKEREVLLQSASATLTDKFRKWWKQGEYRFRFQADGQHFRIWVSDDLRPEEIELEGRSTGLQWFLSFYLIFLVESQEAHSGTILLLDEAGLSLHALAQKDLIDFFESLAKNNQIVHSTHSPFLVDSNHLDRVVAVFVNPDGTTTTSPDLRASKSEAARNRSIYAVHAALGLSVSDVILQGCQPVIVEGPSDQFFLNGVKNYLIGEGHISPDREIVFMPAYGVKGIPAIASIVAGKDESLPFVIVDSDGAGRDMRNKLEAHLYEGQGKRIIDVKEIRDLEGAELEDLMPHELAANVISRELKGPEEDFDESFDKSKPLVPQVKEYAKANGIDLEPGWKVNVAKQVKARLLRKRKQDLPDDEDVERWKLLFKRFLEGEV